VKRIFGCLAITLLSLLVLAAGVTAVLEIYLETQGARRLIFKEINAGYAGEISVKDLRISLVRHFIEVTEAVVKDHEGDDLFLCRSLHLDLSLLRLLRHDLYVNALIIRDPRVNIKRKHKGDRSSLRGAPGSVSHEETGRAFEWADRLNIIINNIDCSGGVFRLHDQNKGIGVVSDGIGIKGNVNLEEMRADLKACAEKILFESEVLSLDLADITMDAYMENGRIEGAFGARDNNTSGDISLRGAVGLEDVFAGGFITEKKALDSITYDLCAELTGAALSGLFDKADTLKGLIYTRLSIKGTGISREVVSASLKGDVSANGLVLTGRDDPEALKAHIDAGIDNGIINIDKLDVLSRYCMLNASGVLDPNTETIDAGFTCNASDMGDALSLFGKQGQGSLKFETHISGSMNRPLFDIDLESSGLEYEGITIGDVDCIAKMDSSGRMDIAELNIVNQGSKVQVGGSIVLYDDFPSIRTGLPLGLSARFENIEPTDFIKDALFKGTVDGDITLSGNIEALDAVMSLEGRDISAGNFRTGDVRLSARYGEGVFYIDSCVVDNNASRISASGSLALFEEKGFVRKTDPEISIDIQGSDVSIGDYTDVLAGRADIKGHLEGLLKHPRGTFELSMHDIETGLQKIQRVDLSSRLDGEKIIIDQLTACLLPEETIEAKGSISYDKQYELNIISRGVSLDAVDLVREKIAAKGLISLDLLGNGSLDNPFFKGDILVKGIRVSNRELNDIKVNIMLKDYQVSAVGDMGFGLLGSYHMKNKTFDASLEFNETGLDPFLKMAGYPDLYGVVSGSLRVKGDSPGLKDIDADMDVKKLSILYDGKEVIGSKALSVSLDDGVISMPGGHIFLAEKGGIDINGYGSIDGSLILEAEGDIPLEGIAPFVEEDIDPAGRIVLSARIKGDYLKPDVSMDITLEDIGFYAPATPSRFHDINGVVNIGPNSIRSEGVEGRLGQGVFSISGNASLVGMQPDRFLVDLKAGSIPLDDPDVYDLLADIDLRLEGTPDKAMIKGSAAILEGTYYKDFRLKFLDFKDMVFRDAPKIRSRRREPPAFLNRIGIDVAIKGRQGVVIDNNLAQVDISPDLHVLGTLMEPVISGRAQVESGTITFKNKEFTLTKGGIDFLNPYKTEPILDIEGSARIRDWNVFLSIYGPPKELVFSLESDPPEEDNDILSLIILGRTTREFIEGEGGSPLSTAGMLAELAETTFGEEVKEATGLDIFDLEGGDTAEDIKVTIGKELTRRITVKYAMESKNNESIQSAIAEYKFLENILLNGFQDSQGAFGAEMQFRLEFR